MSQHCQTLFLGLMEDYLARKSNITKHREGNRSRVTPHGV